MAQPLCHDGDHAQARESQAGWAGLLVSSRVVLVWLAAWFEGRNRRTASYVYGLDSETFLCAP